MAHHVDASFSVLPENEEHWNNFKLQTKLSQHDWTGNPIRGNCLATCLSNLFNLPLIEVPEFETMDVGHNWGLAYIKWLDKMCLERRSVQTDVIPDRLAITNGLSPRGIKHSVITQEGKIIFDPHPYQGGLIEIHNVESFIQYVHAPAKTTARLVNRMVQFPLNY